MRPDGARDSGGERSLLSRFTRLGLRGALRHSRCDFNRGAAYGGRVRSAGQAAMKSRKNHKGAGAAITRRDFLDGVALTAGAMSSGLLPTAIAAAAEETAAQDAAGYYPPALTGLRGNHPDIAEEILIAHTRQPRFSSPPRTIQESSRSCLPRCARYRCSPSPITAHRQGCRAKPRPCAQPQACRPRTSRDRKKCRAPIRAKHRNLAARTFCLRLSDRRRACAKDRAVRPWTVDPIRAAIHQREPAAEREFVALGVAADIVVIIENENARLRPPGAIKMCGRKATDATADDDQIVSLAGRDRGAGLRRQIAVAQRVRRFEAARR
jgi:hypothetical protein